MCKNAMGNGELEVSAGGAKVAIEYGSKRNETTYDHNIIVTRASVQFALMNKEGFKPSNEVMLRMSASCEDTAGSLNTCSPLGSDGR
jgi:hypothetical protein